MNETEKMLLAEALYWKFGESVSPLNILDFCERLDLELEDEEVEEVLLLLEDRP